MLERTAKSREEEVEEWRKRVNEAQQRMVEEQVNDYIPMTM